MRNSIEASVGIQNLVTIKHRAYLEPERWDSFGVVDLNMHTTTPLVDCSCMVAEPSPNPQTLDPQSLSLSLQAS